MRKNIWCAIIIFDNRQERDIIINTKFLRKILILLSCLSLFVSINFFIETYGKYLTDIDEEADIKIARWRILINGDDVRNNSTTGTTITPIFVGNSNIEDNVIAPHAEGYFDLIIDGTDADVSFKYDIAISVSEESSVQDLIVTGYSIDGKEKVETNETTISDTVPLEQENKVISIRVYIKWDDSEDSTMSNEDDTTATMGSDAKMDVNLKFTQVIL